LSRFLSRSIAVAEATLPALVCLVVIDDQFLRLRMKGYAGETWSGKTMPAASGRTIN
jgi:hypothetical protein